MSLEDVIARLEAATAGSRELDWAIHGTPPPPPPAYDWSNVPLYTTSLDAALTLLPEGARLDSLGEDSGDMAHTRLGWTAAVFAPPKDGPGDWWHYGDAPTGPLALCIACLRAQAAA